MTGPPPTSPIWSGTVPLTVRAADQTNAIHADIALTSRRDPRRTLDITITQEADPFFLYSLAMTEDEYHVLKSTQGFVVDFGVFPDKVVELLLLCKDDCKSTMCISSRSSGVGTLGGGAVGKYSAQLVIDNAARPASLQIVETTTFRRIVHLSLDLVPGNDAAVKKYLAGLVSQLKEQLATAKSNESQSTSSLRSQLADALASLDAARDQISSLHAAHADEISRQAQRHLDELSNERSKHMQERDRERRDLESQAHRIRSDLEDQVQSLKVQLSTATRSRDDCSSRLASQDRELAALRDTHSQMLRSHGELESRVAQLQSGKEALTRDLIRHEEATSTLREKVAELEARDRERLSRVHELQRSLELEEQRRASAEKEADAHRARAEALDANYKEATGEIHKGNEIIGKLQDEVKAVKSKLKLKNMVTLQQEKLLGDRSSDASRAKAEVEQLQRRIGEAEEKVRALAGEREKLKAEIGELKKDRDDKQSTIDWLHKRLEEDASRATAPMGLIPDIDPLLGNLNLDAIPRAAAPPASQFRSLSPMRSQTAARIMESVQRSMSPTKRAVGGAATASSARPSMIPVPTQLDAGRRSRAEMAMAGRGMAPSQQPAAMAAGDRFHTQSQANQFFL
ncbi:hypothetical protein BCR44DRAFT_124383, partial [Catenaria anguillulae PL171]